MKTKRRIVWIIKTSCIIITSIVILNSCRQNWTIEDFGPPDEGNLISYNEAASMMKVYSESNPIHITNIENSKDSILFGFKIKSNNLLDLIMKNKLEPEFGKPEEVVFYLGINHSTKDTKIKPNYTLIAMGVDTNGMLLIPEKEADRNDKTQSTIVDKVMTCPPFCPEPQ